MAEKNSFYRDLCKEYLEYRDKSVLYAYMSSRLSQGISRDGSAVRLGQIARAVQGDTGKPSSGSTGEPLDGVLEVLLEVLPLLCRRKRLYQASYETSTGERECAFDLITPLVYGALDYKIPPSLTKNQVQNDLKKLCLRLKGGDSPVIERLKGTLQSLGGRDYLANLLRTVFDISVYEEVERFLYDHGEWIHAEESSRITPPKGRPARRQLGLELLDLWVKRYGSWPKEKERTSSTEETSREDCEKIYHALRASHCDDVLCPLRVDPLTGVGVYVVGKRYYEDAYEKMNLKRKLQQDPNCCCLDILLPDPETGKWRGNVLTIDPDSFWFYDSLDEALEDYEQFRRDLADDLIHHRLGKCLRANPKLLQTPLLKALRYRSQEEFDEIDLNQIQKSDQEVLREILGRTLLKRDKQPPAR